MFNRYLRKKEGREETLRWSLLDNLIMDSYFGYPAEKMGKQYLDPLLVFASQGYSSTV